MEQIEIRDLRRKQFFMVDDEYLNGYARLCGIAATGVYISLCRHTNKAQKAWPTILLIAAELAISDRTVKRAIKTLSDWGIIKTERTRDEKTKRWNVTIYTLTDKTKWKQKPTKTEGRNQKPQDTRTHGATGQKRQEPQDKNDQKPQDTRTSEGYTDDEGNTFTSCGRSKTEPSKPIKAKVETIEVEVIRIFKEAGNNNLTYGNITQRAAINRLTEAHGETTLRKLVMAAIAVQAQPYAPHITTPLELEQKLQKLRDYFAREKGRHGGIAHIS